MILTTILQLCESVDMIYGEFNMRENDMNFSQALISFVNKDLTFKHSLCAYGTCLGFIAAV